MNTLKEQLKTKRPSLSDNSLTTYASILKNVYKNVFNSDDIDIEKFNETDKILEVIKSIEPKKRKIILSALMIITNDKKKFKDISIEIPTKVEDPIFDAGHNASPTSVMIEELEEKEPEPTPEEPQPTPEPDTSFQAYIKEVYDNLKNDAELVYKKKTLSTADYQLIQSFIIVSLLGGMFIKPRKSKDYVDFKIKNIDETNDNHIQKDKLIFNTAEKEIVEIPKPLQSILKKWISINPTEYLLFDTNKNKLSSVKLNQRLNKIFNNKKVSINALIQSFIH